MLHDFVWVRPTKSLWSTLVTICRVFFSFFDKITLFGVSQVFMFSNENNPEMSSSVRFFSSFVLFLCCDDSPADRIVSRKRDFPWRITRNLSIISFHSLVGLIVNLFTTNMDRNGLLWYRYVIINKHIMVCNGNTEANTYYGGSWVSQLMQSVPYSITWLSWRLHDKYVIGR